MMKKRTSPGRVFGAILFEIRGWTEQAPPDEAEEGQADLEQNQQSQPQQQKVEGRVREEVFNDAVCRGHG